MASPLRSGVMPCDLRPGGELFFKNRAALVLSYLEVEGGRRRAERGRGQAVGARAEGDPGGG